MSDNPAPETEAELEAFRRRWREEVQARNRKAGEGSSSDRPRDERRKDITQTPVATAGPSGTRRRDQVDYHEEIAPKSYHDLPDKEEQLKLGADGQHLDRASIFKEPSSALEHYEKAVEKESYGQLGDSINHYRRAFKLDDGVHEAYKKKHFPPSAFVKSKPTNPNPSNASSTVPNTAHHSLQGRAAPALPSTLKQLVDDFSTLRIEPPPPPTDASPRQRSLIAELPEEILSHILCDLATTDVVAFARMAQVCKRLAYLVLTEESIWRHVALGDEFGFGAMHYDYACDIEGFPLDASDQIARYLDSYDDLDPNPLEETPDVPDSSFAFSAHTQHLLHSTYASSWRQLFRSRPRVRFNGCYISTVNYTRPGATSSNTLSWGAPVHVVTYFRYLRFYKDGSAISLLSTAEPGDVVHQLTKANLPSKHNQHASTLPSSVMKDALRGRWRLSGPASNTLDPLTGEDEQEGDVHVETEGVVPKYTYTLQLGLAHAGKTARNNKLAWKGFWSHNRMTDDWGEFGLRNDKAFYWSRVRSYRTEV